MHVDHKGLLIILDGLGDRPHPGLAGLTPLQAAATPTLDQLVAEGQCGLVDPLAPGVPVDTHTGAGALMGISPRCLRGLNRGPVEAVGAGLDLRPGDVALRCNFATVAPDDRGLAILDRRAGRIREGADELAATLTEVALANGVIATVRAATHHRGVLRLRGPGLAPYVTDTDPGSAPDAGRVLDCRPWSDDDQSLAAAVAVNEFVWRASELLADHPVNRRRAAAGLPVANGILTRGAGAPLTVPGLTEYLGLRAAAVAGEKTILGLARMLGYTAITDDRFTSMPDTDLAAKIAAALAALDDHDLVVLHIKAPDVCAHDGDAAGKRDMAERIDAALAPLLDRELVIGVSCDHSTNTQTGHHCGDPVPTILRAPNGRIDGCSGYDEQTCSVGGLGRLTGSAFLATLIDNMGSIATFHPSYADFLD